MGAVWSSRALTQYTSLRRSFIHPHSARCTVGGDTTQYVTCEILCRSVCCCLCKSLPWANTSIIGPFTPLGASCRVVCAYIYCGYWVHLDLITLQSFHRISVTLRRFHQYNDSIYMSKNPIKWVGYALGKIRQPYQGPCNTYTEMEPSK